MALLGKTLFLARIPAPLFLAQRFHGTENLTLCGDLEIAVQHLAESDAEPSL